MTRQFDCLLLTFYPHKPAELTQTNMKSPLRTIAARTKVMNPTFNCRNQCSLRNGSNRWAKLPSTWWILCGSCLLWWSAIVAFAETTSSSSLNESNGTWIPLGQNDSMPVGSHVRLDMTTGERWILSTDPDAAASSDSGSSAMVVSDSGSIETIQQGEAQSVLSDSHVDDEVPNYDYEMMHRTLSQLPEDEIQRIGLPSKDEMSQEEFESKMRTIWEYRQALLQKWENDYLADVPQILKDSIGVLNQYAAAVTNAAEPNSPETVIGTLQDLEYQLSDIDMARDFFTLGGWSTLVQLVAIEPSDDKVPGMAAWVLGTAVKNTEEFHGKPMETVTLLVKTNEEVGSNKTGSEIVPIQTTALQVVQYQYEVTMERIQLLSQANESPEQQQKFSARFFQLQKLLYALGSMMRGNRRAQIAYITESSGGSFSGLDVSMSSSQALAQSVDFLVSMGLTDSNHSNMNDNVWKLIQRFLMLIHDIVSDITLHPTSDSQLQLLSPDVLQVVRDQVIGDLSANAVDSWLVQELVLRTSWCDTILAILQKAVEESGSGIGRSTGETALQAFHSMTPACLSRVADADSHSSLAWGNLGRIRDIVDHLGRQWLEEESSGMTHGDMQSERAHLIASVLEQVKVQL
jgi:hypothetical protein